MRRRDATILDERTPFLEAPPLGEDDHEVYGVPETSHEEGTVYEHCLRAIERGLTRGPHGLPLIGTCDWNDGMNRVGIRGRGESIWLGWFVTRVLEDFGAIVAARGDEGRVAQYRAESERLATSRPSKR